MLPWVSAPLPLWLHTSDHSGKTPVRLFPGTFSASRGIPCLFRVPKNTIFFLTGDPNLAILDLWIIPAVQMVHPGDASLNIDQQSDLPKHSQLKRILREFAKSPDSGMERKLPSERELVEQFKVSRGTVRKAISDLVSEGLLYREKGKGTFVADPQRASSQASRDYPKSLALVLPHTAQQDYLSSHVLRGAEEAARLNGFYLIFAATNDSFDRERETIEDLRKANVKGLVILVADPDYEVGYEHIADLHRQNYPFILIDRFFRGLETDYVVTDNEAGAYKAVSHLIESGHTRIGHITWSTSRATSVEDRLSGYRRALSEHGIPFGEELVERSGEEDDRLRSFIRRLELPTAIFCLNDELALRAMKIIAEEGLRVPQDIAVVGYDDVENRHPRMNTGLTTVRQPFLEIGRVAVTRLLRRVGGEVKPDDPQQVVLTSTLIVRQSSGRIVPPVSGMAAPQVQ